MAWELKSLTIDPAHTITLLGDGANVWSVYVNQGVVSAKKTILIGSQAIGGARFEAYTSDGCVDGGHNRGWTFQNPIPAVATLSATQITPWSFRANGSILSAGGLVCLRRGFCYAPGTTGEPSVLDNVIEETGEFTIGTFFATIPGLARDASYRVRAFAENAVGLSYGQTISVTTIKTAPSLSTGIPTDILTTAATFSGTLLDTGGQDAFRRGFCYVQAALAEPTVADTVAALTGTFGAGGFSQRVSGLAQGKPYRVRAFAENTLGVGYGATQSFTTQDPSPSDAIRLCRVCEAMFMEDPALTIGEVSCPQCGSKMDEGQRKAKR